MQPLAEKWCMKEKPDGLSPLHFSPFTEHSFLVRVLEVDLKVLMSSHHYLTQDCHCGAHFTSFEQSSEVGTEVEH